MLGKSKLAYFQSLNLILDKPLNYSQEGIISYEGGYFTRLPWWQSCLKNLCATQETWVQPLGWEDPLRREWQPTPVFLPGEFHGDSLWDHKESDMTE